MTRNKRDFQPGIVRSTVIGRFFFKASQIYFDPILNLSPVTFLLNRLIRRLYLILPYGGKKLAMSQSNSNGSSALASSQNKLSTSTKKWSLYIKNLQLEKDFGGFVEHLTKAEKPIYFTAIAWDYSNENKPLVYPGVATKQSQFIFELKPGADNTYMIGDGIELWPSSEVTGSLNILIQVFDSHSAARAAGQVAEKIDSQVNTSGLSSVISSIAKGLSNLEENLIAGTVKTLTSGVSQLLASEQDKEIATFQGSFGVELNQQTNTQSYHENGVSIELELVVE